MTADFRGCPDPRSPLTMTKLTADAAMELAMKINTNSIVPMLQTIRDKGGSISVGCEST